MVSRRNDEAGLAVAHGLWRAAGVADDHRQPAGRGLEGGQAEAFGVQAAPAGCVPAARRPVPAAAR